MTLDTNIIIAFFGGDSEVINFLEPFRLHGRPLFLPTVVESEFLSFPNLTAEELKTAELFLEENFTSVSFDRSIAKIAAEIRRATKLNFQMLLLPQPLCLPEPLWSLAT